MLVRGSEWFTPADLAELALAGLPHTKRKINERAAECGWKCAVDDRGVALARHRYVDGWPLHVPTYDEALAIFAAREIILAHHGSTSPYDCPSKIIDRFAELKAAGDAKRQAAQARIAA